MPSSSLTELAAVLAATPPAELLQRALNLVGPHLRADRCFSPRARPDPGPVAGSMTDAGQIARLP